MIARLRGQLVGFGADHAIIDVAGIGYLVSASSRTLSQLGALGEEVVLHTEMLVAEDSIRLVGFSSAAERDWFRLLVSVQGVGSRVALAILSALPIDDLHRAIGASDAAMIARAQGVGPKLALRIVNELRDKAGGIALGPGATQPAKGSHAQDAVSALVNLGFRPAEAASAVSRAEAEQGPEATLDLLVRTALKLASRA